MSNTKALATFSCFLMYSCAALRVKQVTDTQTNEPGQDVQVQDFCDPQATILTKGDAYAVRELRDYPANAAWLLSFAQKASLGIGHRYIEVFARTYPSANVEPVRCLMTMGFWGTDDAADIQFPDWGMAIHTKKIHRCMKKDKTLQECMDELKVLQDQPVEITESLDSQLIDIKEALSSSPLELPESADHVNPKYVMRGKLMREGTLSEEQVLLLSYILEHSKESKHDFFSIPIVKMSIKEGCVYSQAYAAIGHMTGMLGGWHCNCYTVTDRFVFEPLALLQNLQELVDLLMYLRDLGTPTEDLTHRFNGAKEVEADGVSYKCCCTKLDGEVLCRLQEVEALTKGACTSLSQLNVKFSSWNKEHGKCMVTPNDPLLGRLKVNRRQRSTKEKRAARKKKSRMGSDSN